MTSAPARLPAWARKGDPLGSSAREMKLLLRGSGLVTVCEEARCPNLPECFSRGTATFMLLGDRCTRRCDYCAVETARPMAVDATEPQRVAEAARRLGLSYVVLTSVARDDLDDGGAAAIAATVRAVRNALPRAEIEVLTPDFRGDLAAIREVLAASPSVFNHNIETVPRLFPRVRPQGDYRRSLDFLASVKRMSPQIPTKSGLMVGLGESDEEIAVVLADLRSVDVDILTVGQYLQPTRTHARVERYLSPQEFSSLADRARAAGFATVYAGVFVRSSYNAREVFSGAPAE